MREERTKSEHQVDCLTLASFSDGEQRAKNIKPVSSAEPTGHLLAILALAQIALAYVIVKWDTKIVKKQQVILFVFLQSI